MKVFDSIKNKRWDGDRFTKNGNSLILLKRSNAAQNVSLKRGTYNFKIIGKKRAGDGSLNIKVLDKQGKIFFSKKVTFSSGTWAEKNFNLEVKIAGQHRILLERSNNTSGSIEVGRVLLNMNNTKEAEKSLKLRRKHNRNKQALPVIKLDDNIKNLYTYKFEEPNENSKIAFVIPYAIYGGAEVYVKNIINKFEIENSNITVFYLHQNNLQNYIDHPKVEHKYIRSLEKLEFALPTHDFDYIIYYNRLDVYLMLKSLKRSGKINSKLIEIYHSDFLWPGALAGLRSREYVSKVIRVSDMLTNDIAGIEGRRVTIPVGIDLNKFSPRDKRVAKSKVNFESTSKIIMGTVARLSKEKNLDYIIELARQSREKVLYIIIGSGNQLGNLESKIRAFKITNVILLGHKEKVHEYYNIMDGFILPSTIEGTPISIIEAMASGVPVFASKVGAIPTLIGAEERGFYLTKNVNLDLAKIYNRISDKEVVSNAIEYVRKNHDINKCYENFLNTVQTSNNFFSKEKYNNSFILNGEYI